MLILRHGLFKLYNVFGSLALQLCSYCYYLPMCAWGRGLFSAHPSSERSFYLSTSSLPALLCLTINLLFKYINKYNEEISQFNVPCFVWGNIVALPLVFSAQFLHWICVYGFRMFFLCLHGLSLSTQPGKDKSFRYNSVLWLLVNNTISELTPPCNKGLTFFKHLGGITERGFFE